MILKGMPMHKGHESVHGTKKLDKQSLLLIAVNGLFVAANALSGTFLGVYIWKASNNYMMLGWFTLLTHISMALTFWIAGNWVKEGNKMICLRLGIVLSATFYVIVLLLGKKAFAYIGLLGIVQGLAVGFFWLAFNVIYFEVTNADNRDRFNGWTGINGSIVWMIAPWTSGYLISRMAGEKGYRVIFMISLAVFVIGVAVSFFLRNRKTEGNYNWLLTVRILKKRQTPWRPVFGALAAQGLRESVFGIMIGLLVYIQTKSELALGNYTLITSAVGFASFYVTGKWLKPSWRRKGMLLGTIVITAVITPLFTGISFVTLLIYGIGVALFIPLYTIPMTSAVFDLIGLDEASVRHRVEYVVLRELALNTGRIMGMALFLITVYLSQSPVAITSLLMLVGSSPLLSWLFMRHHLAPQSR